MLTSLTDRLDFDDNAGMAAVRSVYDSEIRGNPEIDQKRFRWVIKTLLNKHDSYGCLSLAQDRCLMNVDPKLSGQYLRQIALSGKHLKDKRIVGPIMDHLAAPPEERFEALNLHMLNALSFGVSVSRKQRSSGVLRPTRLGDGRSAFMVGRLTSRARKITRS